MKTPMTMIFAAVVIAGSLGVMPAALAETVTFNLELKASNEVPPNSSKATGTAEVTFDTVTKTLTWTVTYSGLSGPAIGAHFHGPAEAAKVAGIVLPFRGNIASPIKGSATLTDAQAADLLAGRWYINIHTDLNPGGEIRGLVIR